MKHNTLNSNMWGSHAVQPGPHALLFFEVVRHSEKSKSRHFAVDSKGTRHQQSTTSYCGEEIRLCVSQEVNTYLWQAADGSGGMHAQGQAPRGPS